MSEPMIDFDFMIVSLSTPEGDAARASWECCATCWEGRCDVYYKLRSLATLREYSPRGGAW